MLAVRRLVLDHFSRNIYVKLSYILPLFTSVIPWFSESYIYVLLFFVPLFFTLHTTSSKSNKICICICIYTYNCLYLCISVMLSWFSVLFPSSRHCPQSIRVDALCLMHPFLLRHSMNNACYTVLFSQTSSVPQISCLLWLRIFKYFYNF